MSARIAEVIERGAAGVEGTTVLLSGAPTAGLDGGPVPLVDWRSLAWPTAAEDWLIPLRDDPADADALRAAAARESGPYPALRSDELMVLPGPSAGRTALRSIKCRTTDPVPFALLDGAGVASFPNLRGWSAEDTARRAVAEHSHWLDGRSRPPGAIDPGGTGGRELGLLLTAARAALFMESLSDGDPQLPLTAAETARQLADRSPAGRAAADDGLAAYEGFARHATPPPEKLVAALRTLVLELPAYQKGDLIVSGGSGR
jgi:hypothetical protein